MVDIGIALTWIAMSAASAKGLAVFARAVAGTDTDAELAALVAEDGAQYDGSYAPEVWSGARLTRREPTHPVLSFDGSRHSETPTDAGMAGV